MFEAFSVEDYMSSNFTPRLNLVLCMINELFMYSYRGEQLQHESKMISDKIYNSKWYQLNSDNSNRHTLREFKALMQMTMVRADRSIEISAGGFVSMSYDTFLNVSRTYNILSLDLNFWKNFCWVSKFPLFRWWSFATRWWPSCRKLRNKTKSELFLTLIDLMTQK